jgi:hypothetical protein
MAYDLHIVRTENWLEASAAPITKSDADALIASDPELAWSTTDYVDMSDDTGAVTRYWMITWHGRPCFWWYRDQIQCSGPDETQQGKLVQMARALDAYVVGDDGELYPLERRSTPPAKPYPLEQRSTPPAKKTWPLWKQVLAAFLLGCALLTLKLLLFGG